MTKIPEAMIERAAITETERELARHALGLKDGRKQSYRNRYVVDAGEDHAAWCGLVERGLARRRAGNQITGGMDCFWLTRAGAESALNPGEKLDPEDFP
jgi:predicted secreted protein